jgi:D-ribose pyranase
LTHRAVRRSARGILRSGLLNPQLLSLLARIRHTNTLVIADAMFPSWTGLETVDLALVYGVPAVPRVLEAVLANWKCGAAWMADEFQRDNPVEVQAEFARAFRGAPSNWEPYLALKARVPKAIGLIRTGEQRSYTKVVLESA